MRDKERKKHSMTAQDKEKRQNENHQRGMKENLRAHVTHNI